MRASDLTGLRFGRLTVDTRISSDKFGKSRWLCRCDCGGQKITSSRSLVGGKTRSCGCLHREYVTDPARHPKVVCAVRRLGENYIRTDDPWFINCSRRMRSAARRGIEFGFGTPQEFAVYCKSIATERCPILGISMAFNEEKVGANSFSIDRIDPCRGYVRGNIQIISAKANMMKSNASVEEMLNFATWVGKVYATSDC